MRNPIVRPRAALAATVLLACFAIAPVSAQTAADPAGFGGLAGSADALVDVTAQDLEMVDAERLAIFTGEVVVVQGTMTMRAPRLVALYGEGGPSDLINFTASGGRVEMDFDDQTTFSDEAFYDFEARILTLSGNVEVVGGASTVQADQLIVDTRAGTSRFSGGPAGNGRVNAIFQPAGG